MYDEVRGVRFDGICSSWGANDVRKISTLDTVECVIRGMSNHTARTTRCAVMAAKNGAPV